MQNVSIGWTTTIGQKASDDCDRHFFSYVSRGYTVQDSMAWAVEDAASDNGGNPDSVLSYNEDIKSLSLNQYSIERDVYNNKSAWIFYMKVDANSDFRYKYVVEANTCFVKDKSSLELVLPNIGPYLLIAMLDNGPGILSSLSPALKPFILPLLAYCQPTLAILDLACP